MTVISIPGFAGTSVSQFLPDCSGPGSFLRDEPQRSESDLVPMPVSLTAGSTSLEIREVSGGVIHADFSTSLPATLSCPDARKAQAAGALLLFIQPRENVRVKVEFVSPDPNGLRNTVTFDFDAGLDRVIDVVPGPFRLQVSGGDEGEGHRPWRCSRLMGDVPASVGLPGVVEAPLQPFL